MAMVSAELAVLFVRIQLYPIRISHSEVCNVSSFKLRGILTQKDTNASY